MTFEIIITDDGSPTLKDSRNETFHSRHGAIQETRHVFIDNGLTYFCNTHPNHRKITISEIGFGTGLNAAIAMEYAQINDLSIDFITCDTHPLPLSVASQFNLALANYAPNLAHYHAQLIHSKWNQPIRLTPTFQLSKYDCPAHECPWPTAIDLVWMDAFSPTTSPECWSESTLGHLLPSLNINAVLTTYCAKGNVRRLFQSLGFTVERLQGPPGKREMIRATLSNRISSP